MKTKNILGLLLMAAFSIGVTSCSSEDDPIEVKEVTTLTPEVNDLKIVVGKSTELKLTKGNGDYKAFSLNPEIADVKIENGKILVEAKKNGNTAIVLSDQSNQFKKVSIASYYENIITDKEVIDIKMPIGNPKTAAVTITGGNDGYSVTSDKDILSTSVEKNIVTIIARKEGTANITIKDAFGLTKVITVNITTTDIAFEERDLEIIKAEATSRHIFINNIHRNNDNKWYKNLNSIENGLNLYGFDYYNYQYIKLYFSGDKTLGVKANAKITCEWNDFSFTDQPIKLEIIKNDGTKIWAVYSFVKDGKLYFGHFCQNINAE